MQALVLTLFLAFVPQASLAQAEYTQARLADDWGTLTAFKHVPAVDAERIGKLITAYHNWIKLECQRVYSDDVEQALRCIPPKPREIAVYVTPFRAFWKRWLEGVERAEVVGTPELLEEISRSRGNLNGYTEGYDNEVYQIFFSQVPIDMWIVHEVTHVFEFQRGDPQDEGRTHSRTYEFMRSEYYANWIEKNY